jgi:hypothetical protein
MRETMQGSTTQQTKALEPQALPTALIGRQSNFQISSSRSAVQ